MAEDSPDSRQQMDESPMEEHRTPGQTNPTETIVADQSEEARIPTADPAVPADASNQETTSGQSVEPTDAVSTDRGGERQDGPGEGNPSDTQPSAGVSSDEMSGDGVPADTTPDVSLPPPEQPSQPNILPPIVPEPITGPTEPKPSQDPVTMHRPPLPPLPTSSTPLRPDTVGPWGEETSLPTARTSTTAPLPLVERPPPATR
ncbi:hypothetical protein HK104_007173, partial [Borealophlyctis nickersoniae]